MYSREKYVKYLTMFTLSSHSLGIETGRYQGVLNVNTVCKFCQNDIEDEFHFILKCPTYQNFRSKYIKSYFRTRPSVFKLVQLLSTENVKELCNLGKFLINAYKLRENLISVFQASPINLTIFLYYYLCNIYTIVINCSTKVWNITFSDKSFIEIIIS